MSENKINLLKDDSLADVSGGLGNVSVQGDIKGDAKIVDKSQVITTTNETSLIKIKTGDIGSGNSVASGNKGTIGATAEVAADFTVGYKGGTTYPTTQ